MVQAQKENQISNNLEIKMWLCLLGVIPRRESRHVARTIESPRRSWTTAPKQKIGPCLFPPKSNQAKLKFQTHQCKEIWLSFLNIKIK